MVAVEFNNTVKKEKIMKPDRKQNPKVYIVAQELELVRILAGNDQKAKDKALKNLNKWLLKRSKTMPFKEEDFQRIWKGLFYCMWMSDKPLIQEDCAEKISKLVHFTDLLPTSLLFFKAGMFILIQEWNGIDQLRLDKFLMLVRRLLRETLRALKQHLFTEKNIQRFNEVLSETILNNANNNPVGLFMHFNEIFLEELAKVTQGKIHRNSVVTFLRPFMQRLAKSHDVREIGYIRRFIFGYLMKQSDVGLDYQEKYEAWKQQGFPGSINSMQKVKIDKDDESSEDEETVSSEDPKEKPLDPRAGRVDVEIPQIHFNAKDVANALLEYKFDKNSSAHSRNIISLLSQQFNTLAKGVYPLGIKKIDVKDKKEDINIRKSAKQLIKFEQKLLGKDRKRKRDKENNEIAVEKKRKVEDNENVVGSNIEKKKSKNRKQQQQEIATNEESAIKPKKSKKKNKKNKHTQDNAGKARTEKNNTLTLLNDNRLDANTLKNKEKKGKLDKIKAENSSQRTGATKSKKIKNNSPTLSDNLKIKSNIVNAKDKLKDKKVKKLNRKRRTENVECIFERNSGTWIVYEIGNYVPTENQRQAVGIEDSLTPAKSSKKVGRHDIKEIKEKSSPNRSSDSSFSELLVSRDDSPKAGMAPVKLFESPPEKKEIFPKTEWDEPLQEGEYEICIPSKKFIGKMKKQAKNKNKSVHEIINTTLEKIKGKSRLSLPSRLANNPFSKPNSAKKVKINTKLNKSQEVHEHIANVKSSPAIPYDSAKKPSKPLLKPTATSTPVNPFYKKQLTFLG